MPATLQSPFGVQCLTLRRGRSPSFGLVNVLGKKKGHPSSVILPGFFPRNVLFAGVLDLRAGLPRFSSDLLVDSLE